MLELAERGNMSASTEVADTIMQIRGLTKIYNSGFHSRNCPPAVSDISFDIKKGRFIALIGESGSGKTTVGRLILRLLKPTYGVITYQGTDIQRYKKNGLKEYYRGVQSIFQDPFSSFNPLFKVDRIFKMISQSFLNGEENLDEKTEKVIHSVGMSPKEVLGKYPHQLSGGQLQRLLIARALLLDVKLLVADELISMLDASTRIDVLNLLGGLAYDHGMSVLFITHDLSLGYYISEETLIMYRGRIIESGKSTVVFANPLHPYTKMLLTSVANISKKWDKGVSFLPETIENEVSNFYACNRTEKSGLVELESEHRVILNT
jgi:peptide/nickel transport system ATP-binding protein